ncbi:triose phosphate/phosphate translocator, chloroplastic [Plakobranchus ocellatus]|uniref:Triose phosphate/phosphate translocator, chloroplastic n=1 Tax=Plakobranchus ocellatus TaxID=259542 RepID=A0AAV4BM12_9GAST|nr:triose phosphate/phosphate translocator, chloroplastic [Plakobranchus ocellatus]
MISNDLPQGKTPHIFSPWSLGVFLSWTVTSFLCHHFAKMFLGTSAEEEATQDVDDFSAIQAWRGATRATVLTFVQMALCFLLVNVESPDSGWSVGVARACHVIATWFTNFSMACMFASCTFAIKLMEPITSAAVQYLVLGTPLSPIAIISLPIIVGGAITFSGNPFTQSSLSLGIAAAFASNLVLAFRNVALKVSAINQEKKSITFRPMSQTFVACVVVCIIGAGTTLALGLIPDNALYASRLCVLSGVLHVLYSYVSTGIVLLHLSVVSHAVSNILKRVLVVLLLYGAGNRSASPLSFVGLIICTLGLLLYAWTKRDEHRGKEQNDANYLLVTQHLKTGARLFFLATAIICGGISLGILSSSSTSIQLHHSAFFQSETLPHTSGIGPKFERTFTNLSHELPVTEDLLPDLGGYLAEDAQDIQEFLQEDLLTNPNMSSYLSSKLRTRDELVKESQRLHFDIIGKALQQYKYAMLLDIAVFENKGDSCITVGETYFLARIKLQVIYYCSAFSCDKTTLAKAAIRALQYSPDELVILVHGGGNVVGYPSLDKDRFTIIEFFKNFQIFVFPQSILIRDLEGPHLKNCAKMYCCNENLTFVMRDHLSYSLAKKHFQGGATKFLLAPDTAFQIGSVPRFMSPVFDILWIRRTDKEKVGYHDIPAPPPGIRLHVTDWPLWVSPSSPNKLEKAHYICTNGFFFLQRGRVLITDRLHGHILATLLDMPNVIIDNNAHKLSSYHRSWTAALENTLMTDDPAKALDLAIELLTKYNSTLSPRVPFLHIDEFMLKDNTFAQPDMSYV